MRLFYAFLIFIFIPATSIARTYYVSPTGSNSNVGTSVSTPWQTIVKINNTTFNGDTILFQGGSTFAGSIGFGFSDLGTPTKPIVIGSYGIGRATISSGNSYGISIYNAGGFKIKNLIFKGSGRTTNTAQGIRVFLDKPLTRLTYIKIDSVEVYGYGNSGIAIGSWNKAHGFEDVSVTNSLSHDNATSGISTYADTNYLHKNIYIAYNQVYNNPGILENTIGSSGSGIVLGNVDGAVIEYCTSWNNGWLHSNSSGGPVGIWAYASNNVIIQFNESHHNKTGNFRDGGGFDFDGGCTNSIMQYNYSHDNHGAGYLMANYAGSPLMKNIIVRYNISENDSRKNDYGGIHISAPSDNPGFQTLEIYNNTVYVTPNLNGNNSKAFFVRSGKLSGVNIRNNIFQTTGGIQLLNLGQIFGITFQGNNYWSTGGSFRILWGGTNYSSLTSWRTATGQEKINGTSSGLQSDPRFADTTTGVTFNDPTLLSNLIRYKLKPTSDLITRGLNLTSLFGLNVGPRDFWGNSLINKNIFNIGAYQPALICPPISCVICPSVVKNLPLTINFTGSEGGLQDKNGATTGFTMVDKPSAPLVVPTHLNFPGYEPSKLQIASGKLTVTTTAGISYLNPAQSAKTNSQVNALGVGFVAPSKFIIQTTLAQPNAGTGTSEQAGLWFGLDEDNFVKLVVVSAGSGNSKIEMRKEVGASSSSTDLKSSGSMILSSSLVKLKFIVDKVANTIEAFYSINGGSDIIIGTLSIPQSFTAGKTLSDGATQNITFAGIFATHRSATTALNFNFEDFKVEAVAVLPNQCSPISSFSCPAIVKQLPCALNFIGSEGGLQDKSGVQTGFTMVDKPSAPLVTPTYSNIPGYEPSKLQISGDKLIITTTAGISYLNRAQSANTNSQVNALGVGFVSPSKFTIQTTLVQPNAGTGKSEQAGLWFGLDEDNFVKLVVVSAGSGNSKVEMRKEVAAMSSSADVKSSGSMILSSSLVKLKFLIDKALNTIQGFYSINGGAEISIGTLSIPQSFTAGKTLSDGVTQNITFAGVYATHRSATTPLNFSFEDFKVEGVTTATLLAPEGSLLSTIANNSLRSQNNFEKPRVYPNPVQKRFNVEFPATYKGNFTIQIVDQLGKIYEIGKYRLKSGGSNIEIDISHLLLKAGIYALRIHSDTRKIEVIKLAIQ